MSGPPSYLPLLLLGLALLSSVWRWAELMRRGTNAMVLGGGKDLRGLLEVLFGFAVAAMTLFAAAFAMEPHITHALGPLEALEPPLLAWYGAALGAAGVALLATAQFHMGASWRVGVPKDECNALVTRGLYRYSRNPIYLGMLLALTGVFLMAPNAVTLSLLLAGWIAISAQIRLEEDYLRRIHGKAFAHYCDRTRRWL
jgi:protein-S-isoprenylcysteine O-methyltransferase Ste14